MDTSFRHDLIGTPSAAWDDVVEQAAVLPWAAVLRHTDLLVVAPHPDDESLGAGGLIAGACAAGTEVTVVCCTDGEAADVDLGPAGGDLAHLRRDEIDVALRELSDGSPTTPRLVRCALPDGRLAEHRTQLERVLRPLVHEAGLVVGPWQQDGHPDHEVVGSVCTALCEEVVRPLLLYPVWMWHWGSPSLLADLDLVRVPLPEALATRKGRAIDAHLSQRRPSIGPAILPDSVIEHFGRDSELFVRSTDMGHRESGDRTSAEFFDAMYASTPGHDPWSFATSDSERSRLDLVVAELGERRYRSCFEPGCSVGELTERLSLVSENVLAMDIAPTAIAAARERHGDLAGVEFRVGSLAHDLGSIDETFDLIVLSEIGYYLGPDELRRVVIELCGYLEPGGTLLAAHWTGVSADHSLSGEQTHDIVRSAIPWMSSSVRRGDTVLIEKWECK